MQLTPYFLRRDGSFVRIICLGGRRRCGIPRLKLAKDAPSRSALKLEEALVSFLSPNERWHRAFATRWPWGRLAAGRGIGSPGWTRIPRGKWAVTGRKAMNEPARRKGGRPAGVARPGSRGLAGVRRAAMGALLALACLPAAAQLPCPGIHVKVLDIRNSTGTVACALFESAQGFPVEFLQSATNIMIIRIRKSQARCDFEDIPPGTYALAVIHDENMNGKLDTQWLGIPTEGYGFSNDARATFVAPSFAAASFPYDGETLEMTISLHY